MFETINETILAIAAIVGPIAAWYSARRKTKADAAQSELENVQKAIKIWRETAEGFQQKCDELMVEMEGMRRQNRDILNELEQTRHENKELKAQIQRLQQQLNKIDHTN